MTDQSIDYTKIKETLYTRLSESGWCDQARLIIRSKMKESPSLELNEIVNATLPKVRGLVPDSVKREMLQKLKNEILDKNGYFDTTRKE